MGIRAGVRRGLLAAVAAVLVVVALAAAGGSSGGGHKVGAGTSVASPVGTSQQDTTTTTPGAPSTTVVNPAVVPAVIDKPYLDAVFAQLDQLNGDIVRLEMQTGRFPHAAAAILRALYAEPDYSLQLQIAGVAITHLADVRNPPGNPKTTISRIISASPNCVFVQGSVDYSGTVLDPTPAASDGYISIVTKATETDPHGVNPTRWAISSSQVTPNPAAVRNPCAHS